MGFFYQIKWAQIYHMVLSGSVVVSILRKCLTIHMS